MVYNLALQYVQNAEDAMDITQEVFVALHQSLTTFKGEAQLSTWVYRIAINKSLDFIKAKNRKKRFAWLTSLFNPDTNALQFDIHTFEHPGVILEQKEALAKIFRFINELSENQKTALILSKIEQKSQVEIAEIMNLSTKAVESLVQRAKQNLEKKLNQ
jgi:RNA polymerase sigma-70 factor (ECF subfamily)